MPLTDRIILEVGWVGDRDLLVKEVDRAARRGSVVIFQDGESQGTVTRILGKDGEEGDDGWIDHVRMLLLCLARVVLTTNGFRAKMPSRFLVISPGISTLFLQRMGIHTLHCLHPLHRANLYGSPRGRGKSPVASVA